MLLYTSGSLVSIDVLLWSIKSSQVLGYSDKDISCCKRQWSNSRGIARGVLFSMHCVGRLIQWSYYAAHETRECFYSPALALLCCTVPQRSELRSRVVLTLSLRFFHCAALLGLKWIV